jgi:hypothetical protein
MAMEKNMERYRYSVEFDTDNKSVLKVLDLLNGVIKDTMKELTSCNIKHRVEVVGDVDEGGGKNNE